VPGRAVVLAAALVAARAGHRQVLVLVGLVLVGLVLVGLVLVGQTAEAGAQAASAL
jgi:hypothetical protein